MNWSLLQNGIGIDIQAGNFTAVCVKRQWKRISVADRLEIPNYQAAGPQECGKLYREFLRRNGLKAPWTVVALPRAAVLLRWLNFPPAAENDLAQAVQFQLESLHPFEEDAVYWDFASRKMPAAASSGSAESIEVPIAIAEKKYVDETASWLEQAGIGVSQFTVTTAALLAAIGTHLGLPPSADSWTSGAFFLLSAGRETIQVIGYAPGSLVSKEISSAQGESGEPAEETLAAVQRELELGRSELRLDPQARPPLVLCGKNVAEFAPALAEQRFETSAIERHFPFLHTAAESFRLPEDAVAFVAALAAADRSLPFSLNLLPPEKRSYQSPLIYVPAYVLTGLIIVLSIALGLRGTFQDWRYERYIERRIKSLQPQLQAVEAAQEQSRKAYERLARLTSARKTAALPVEVLNELTRIFPDDVWLQMMQYDGETLSLVGYAKSASPLLETLANSSYFESPQFLSAISKSPDGKEVFRIGVRLRKGR